MYTFAYSQKGARHSKAGLPCQDSSGTRSLSIPGLGRSVCLAVADGLSSSARSDQGSAAAVHAFLEHVTQALQTDSLDQEQREQELLDIARGGVESALAAVEALADGGQPLSAFDTTLCGAILAEAGLAVVVNVGDSGAVCLFDDGTYQFVTRRDKGAEANTVYPLSSTEKWRGRVLHGVAGVVLATDGILDLFVSDAATSNMVFWPFAEQLLRPLSSQAEVSELEAGWKALLSGKSSYYKDFTLGEIVDDDLTVAVAAQDADVLQNALEHVAWPGAEAFRQELDARRRRAWPGLYGGEDGGEASTANRAQNHGKQNHGKPNNGKPNRMRKPREPHAQAKPPEPRKGG